MAGSVQSTLNEADARRKKVAFQQPPKLQIKSNKTNPGAKPELLITFCTQETPVQAEEQISAQAANEESTKSDQLQEALMIAEAKMEAETKDEEARVEQEIQDQEAAEKEEKEREAAEAKAEEERQLLEAQEAARIEAKEEEDRKRREAEELEAVAAEAEQ